jgi:hypothetical protein
MRPMIRHDWRTHNTIELPGKVEPHQADNDTGKGQYSCEDIHDERPSPWPSSGVDLPFKFKSGGKFPPILGINGDDLVGVEKTHM